MDTAMSINKARRGLKPLEAFFLPALKRRGFQTYQGFLMKYLIGAVLGALIVQALIVSPIGATPAPDDPPSPPRGSDRR